MVSSLPKWCPKVDIICARGLGPGSPAVVLPNTFLYQTGALGLDIPLVGEGVLILVCLCACANTFALSGATLHKPLTPTSSCLGPEPGMGPGCDPDLPCRPPTWFAWGLPGTGKGAKSQLLGTTLPLGGYGPAPVVYSSAVKNRPIQGNQRPIKQSHFPSVEGFWMSSP